MIFVTTSRSVLRNLIFALVVLVGWTAAEQDAAAQDLRCTPDAIQAAAPRGIVIGPVSDLNKALPQSPTGVTLVSAKKTTPAYCLVTGTIVTNETTRKTTNFGVALPLKWAGRFLFSGSGGYCGILFATLPDDPSGGGYPADALVKGYSISSTDDGHSAALAGFAFDATWALPADGKPNADALTDYYYRAVHSVIVTTKQLVTKVYASAPSHAYYAGCSDGGREGMVEADRYPEDFDGFTVGDPFFNVPGQLLAGRAARATLQTPDSYLPPAALKLVDHAVQLSCDQQDGVQDSLIQNPGKCDFKPESLLCHAGQKEGCLSQAQVQTVSEWSSSVRDKEGKVVSFGFPVSDLYNDGEMGANLFAWAETKTPPQDRSSAEPWGPSLLNAPLGWNFYDQGLKYIVEQDPKFDSTHHEVVSSKQIVNQKDLEKLEATTKDGRGDDPTQLARFSALNRKMILYHGFSDGFINPFNTIQFYEDWSRLKGGFDASKQEMRLFMLPGMYHCGGGPGPNTFDALGAIEQWVEHGKVPEAITVTKYTNDSKAQGVARTMPLCSFPKQAQYKGSGETNNADNWSCTENSELLQVGPAGIHAGLQAK